MSKLIEDAIEQLEAVNRKLLKIDRLSSNKSEYQIAYTNGVRDSYLTWKFALEQLIQRST